MGSFPFKLEQVEFGIFTAEKSEKECNLTNIFGKIFSERCLSPIEISQIIHVKIEVLYSH